MTLTDFVRSSRPTTPGPRPSDPAANLWSLFWLSISFADCLIIPSMLAVCSAICRIMAAGVYDTPASSMLPPPPDSAGRGEPSTRTLDTSIPARAARGDRTGAAAAVAGGAPSWSQREPGALVMGGRL
eukprot:CAMPEP_0194315688 /NCGR_PEP_ID=MMETSP0171-20130528/12489_1 /TAXON_ID=218684 /ORGANISM="Corethron pennatum, Strain L29A3" /LENGTH=127 /DNA_ID=CAMNT_0039071605 /DNA_START=429 /DNA_END=813 /DNA_ORIENTATION=+